MMKLFSVPSLALIAALMPIEPALAANATTVTLNPTNDSNMSGTANLTPKGNKT
jgi:hypothetical protein